MKRLFTLFFVALTCTIGVWAQGAVYFQNPVVEFRKTTSPIEEPRIVNGHYYYQQDVFYVASEGADPVNLSNYGWEDNDFVWSVDVTGDITIPVEYRLYPDAASTTHFELKSGSGYGSNIYFDCTAGGSGTLTVTATNPDYNGHVYTCSYTIYYHTDVKSVKWDFCGKMILNERMSEKSDLSTNWLLSDVLAYQTTYADAGNNEANATALYWFKDGGYFTTGSYKTFEGVTAAAGLQFKSDAVNKIGICNESTTNVNNAHRCIALKKGASFSIPASNYSDMTVTHPRVRIKMGRYGGTGDDVSAHLTITNATDALGTTITGTGTYQIGGSAWWGDKNDNNQRGEYHFTIVNKEQDFTITVEDGQWIMLYTIEVYASETMMTENSVLGDKYQLLNTGTAGSAGAKGTYWLHYRGKGEKTTLTSSNGIHISGEVTMDYTSAAANTAGKFDALSNVTQHTYTSKIGDTGTFYIILQSKDLSGTYCTDYADRRMSVGYMKKVDSYPYTWDFTDIRSKGNLDVWYEGANYPLTNRNLWDGLGETSNEWRMRVAQDGGHNILYCGGSQLWFGKHIINETAGLAFTPVNFDKTYNESIILNDKGLTFDQKNRDWWGWRVTVPSVPAKGAVYVRAKNIGSQGMRHVKFWIMNEGATVGNKTGGEIDFWDASYSSTTNHNRILVEGSSDEYIYAIYNNDPTNAKDITLFFNEVEVKKMAVSTDLKTFNAKGWTTESRNHDIDPALTAEMNGRNITTYLVTGVDYTKKRVTMTPINDYLMPAASGDHQPEACILKNSTESTLNIVNGGFYLFVPDMHDEQGETSTSGYKLKNYYNDSEHPSIMKSKLNPAYPANYFSPGSLQVGTPIPYQSEGYTNFAFTYQYYALDGSGNTQGDVIEGLQGFYRIANNGGWSYGNQGYLPLVTSQIDSDIMGGARGFELSFDDDEGGEVTAIENIETSKSEAVAETAIYYSLSGQKLSGKPAKGGIYICNGKKIAIK